MVPVRPVSCTARPSSNSRWEVRYGNSNGTAGAFGRACRGGNRTANGEAAVGYVPVGGDWRDLHVDDAANARQAAREPVRRAVGADVFDSRALQQDREGARARRERQQD